MFLANSPAFAIDQQTTRSNDELKAEILSRADRKP